MIEAEGARIERRRSAVVEIRKHLSRLYRGFVWGASLYGEVEDHYERVEGPDPLASRRAIQPIFATVSVPHGR